MKFSISSREMLVSLAMLLAVAPGCYRMSVDPDAEAAQDEIEEARLSMHRAGWCEVVFGSLNQARVNPQGSTKHTTGESLIHAGKCVEEGHVKANSPAWQYYYRAIDCGFSTAGKQLERLGCAVPKTPFTLGESEAAFVVTDWRPDPECGVSREYTAWGWVLLPLAFPVEAIARVSRVAFGLEPQPNPVLKQAECPKSEEAAAPNP